jgi:beta-lactamase regulating signal transducer with metallopeptidase domain
MSSIITHLWTSTLVLVAALLAARFLPLTARTRFAVLMAGVFKFALPAWLLITPLRFFGIDLEHLGATTKTAMAMAWLTTPGTLPGIAPLPATLWRSRTLIVIWVAIAIILFAIWTIARTRLVLTALRSSRPASAREHAALAAARLSLGMRASVDVVRSSIYEAPSVVRMIRPVIVLPDGACDTLDESELESLLLHECAHVSRRDNVLGFLESVVVAAFWFHPLVWLAQRALATAREEACDEEAAANGQALETYSSALSKICSAILAPRLAGVSCMASAHLKERLGHLMNYEQLKKRALSHRAVLTAASVLLLAVTVSAGVRMNPEAEPRSARTSDPYLLRWSISKVADDRFVVHGSLIEIASGHVVAQPRLEFLRGTSAISRSGTQRAGEEMDYVVDLTNVNESVNLRLQVKRNSVTIQDTTYIATTKAATTSRFTGEPITVQLKDADIKDLLRTFKQLTNTEIVYPDSLEGKVTIDVRDMPWDEALDTVLRQNGYSYEVQDGKILVTK